MTTIAVSSQSTAPKPIVASPSQRDAIEAPARPLLVLAGPGAGKTFCLTERIRFLIEHLGFDPARICAFTFTNKAAGEIEHRLETQLGASASKIKRGTIHAFCAELLRELGAGVLLEPGFGIADEEYQLSALRRIEGYRRWHRNTLNRFSAHRFRGDALMHDDAMLFDQYERFLSKRRLVDFDTLVIKAAELLERSEEGATIRARWDAVLEQVCNAVRDNPRLAAAGSGENQHRPIDMADSFHLGRGEFFREMMHRCVQWGWSMVSSR